MQRLMITCVLALAAAGAAAATGLGFLAKGPMAKFNDADMKLLNSALEQALTAEQPGAPIEWRNEKSGASGVITPERLFEDSGRPCRELRIVNRHRQVQASGVYTMCLRNGRWEFKS